MRTLLLPLLLPPLRDTTLLLNVLETISVKMGDEMPHMTPASTLDVMPLGVMPHTTPALE